VDAKELMNRQQLFAICTSIALVIGFALGYWQQSLKRRTDPQSLQNNGEALLSETLLKCFNGENYHLLNHVTLRYGDLTTQVDHILVSRFGIFVIETKNFRGFIFANSKHKNWTQATYWKKSKFQNPIHQNYIHVKAVQELLDFVPPNVIQSIVVFVGDAQFKTDMPAGVFTLPQLVEHLKNSNNEVLTLNRLQFCVGRLETARLKISQQTDLEHVQALKRRFGHLADQ